MEEKLKEFYSIKMETDFINYEEGIIFFSNDNKYFFVKHNFDEDYLLELNELSKQLQLKGIYLHEFVFNKNNKFDSDGFCLMKINCFGEEITDYELKKFYSLFTFSDDVYKNFVSVEKLWYKKIDYIEYQLSELSDSSIINNSCDYYIGICEILLEFFVDNVSDESKNYLSLCHRKLKNFSSIDFYNPLNIIFDVYIRDLAMYIKYNKDYKYLRDYLDKISNNRYLVYYFFIRLLLPSEYFELIEEILIDKKGYDKLINYINKNFEYEIYIGKICDIFNIYLFPWIKKSN